MKHCREDYQEAIVDLRFPPTSTRVVDRLTDPGKQEFAIPEGTAIHAEEPVFLLRAQDPFAADIVAQYAFKIEANARTDADRAFAQLAHRQADLMAAWPHKKAYPDAPGVNEPVVAPVDRGPAEAAPAPIEDNGPH